MPDAANRARLAVAWATGFQLFRDVVQFGLTLALVRLLPAEAYGQFGFLTTLLSFFTLYSFREFLGQTLQVRDDERVHYQDHFTAGAVVQLILFGVINVVAIGFRWLPAYAPVSGLLHVMSVLVILDLPSEFRVRMLERDLDWRRLRSLQAIGFVGSGIVSVLLAFAGAGVLALLLPILLVPLPFIYDLFVRAGFRPTWAFSWDRFQPAWRFGWARIATVSFVAVATMTETAWLTSALGFGLLGIYGRATGLAQLCCGRLAGLLALSVYPVLTRLDPDSDSFRRASAMYLRSVGWAVVPLAAVAAMLAAPVVQLIYGQKWTSAIPLVPAAMGAAAVGALVQTAYTLLLAHGRQKQCLVVDAWRLAGTLMALGICLSFGPGIYLLGIICVHVVSLALVATLLQQHRAIVAAAVWQAVLPPLAASSLASGVAWLAADQFVIWPALLFLATYVAAMRSLFPKPFAELIAYLPQSGRIHRWLGFPHVASVS